MFKISIYFRFLYLWLKLVKFPSRKAIYGLILVTNYLGMSSASAHLTDDELKLNNIEKELSQINKDLRRLNDRKNQLIQLKDQLRDEILLKKSNSHTSDDWDKKEYPWSKDIKNVLNSTFKLNEFRTNQLAAINIALMKKDAIIIMPTGSGKSLCYQLPAMIGKGVTIVISPMISLMEDQIRQLRNLKIESEMLQSSNTREENNKIFKLMTESSSLKLLYVSPEKLAKSKTFMTKLQKLYKMSRLDRIAIDEVHCCSTWGHDFRPDYQYLSILKTMFPDIPLLGLTATATTKVMLDVQKMLQIEGCIVIKAPFNRPNLFYEVRVKPSTQKDCIDELANLMSNRFRNQSGIIYTTSIKECEDLRDELRKKGLRISAYHAKLESNVRSKVHTKWLSGEYQAVVATIAFGLGIDKPDVRFVIHHCLSKSMENFYQESGRAGRDGINSYCILYYKLADIFKLSPMVFDQQTGLQNLYNIVDYCLDQHRCRRSIIASYFDEQWNNTDCNQMCDHCKDKMLPKPVDITKHAKTLCSILDHVMGEDISVTAGMLIDLWYKQKVAKIKNAKSLPFSKAPSFSRETGENIMAYLLIKNYLKQDFHFTPYSTISYLKSGPNSKLLNDEEHKVIMTLASKSSSQSESKKKERSKSPKLKSPAEYKKRTKRNIDDCDNDEDDDVCYVDEKNEVTCVAETSDLNEKIVQKKIF